MRRTGSEEIGSSKTLRRGSDSCLLRVLLSVHFFGEAPERRPWILEHDDAGRFLPGFALGLSGEATHRFCYRAVITNSLRCCPQSLFSSLLLRVAKTEYWCVLPTWHSEPISMSTCSSKGLW